MVYHIVSTGSPYALDLYKFFDKYRKELKFESTFISYSKEKIEDHRVPVRYYISFFAFFKFFLLLKKDDKVIFHGYFHPYLYLIPVFTFWNLKKITWLIWGSDLYYYTNTLNKPFKYRIYAFFRNISVRRFEFLAGANSDYALGKSYYKIKKNNQIKIEYPLDWYAEKYFCSPKAHSLSYKVILGNSADPSNNHEEGLNILSKYKEENIEIFSPLSYGGDEKYINSIISLGREIFGDKFHPLTKKMSKKDYIEFLSCMDMLVFTHNRQQGLGNVRMMLMMGKKIFIKPNNASNEYLNSMGIEFYNSDNIKNLSFENFISYPKEIAEHNLKALKNEFSDEKLIQYWNKIFE